MKRNVLGLALVGAMMLTATACIDASGRVYVRVAPPPIVAERRGPAPGPDFVWVSGFYRWDGGRYTWAPGHYEHAPRPRARWVEGRWAHGRHGWYYVEGHWR